MSPELLCHFASTANSLSSSWDCIFNAFAERLSVQAGSWQDSGFSDPEHGALALGLGSDTMSTGAAGPDHTCLPSSSKNP